MRDDPGLPVGAQPDGEPVPVRLDALYLAGRPARLHLSVITSRKSLRRIKYRGAQSGRLPVGGPSDGKDGFMRAIWLAAGLVSLGLGNIGAVLPLLPTTPFLLLAVFCFARSSPALERWIMDHPGFGPAVRDWRERGAIGRRGKIGAVVAVLLSLAASLAIGAATTILAVQVAVMAGVLLFVLSRPTA